MSKMSVYGWIRESVRRAVLLGFSDAVEQLGDPETSDRISPHLSAILKDKTPLLAAAGEPAGAITSSGPSEKPRRRLGRSLSQIRPAGEQTT